MFTGKSTQGNSETVNLLGPVEIPNHKYDGELTSESVKDTKGAEYTGRYKDGKYHGAGILRLPSGERYNGSFEHGKYHGPGVLTLPTGERYVGQFRDGVFQGLP